MSLSSALPALIPPASPHGSIILPDGRLRFSDADLAAAIALAGPPARLSTILLKHAATSLKLALVGIHYLCQGEASRKAYQSMTTKDFSIINARQAWANWRIIPRNLHENLPVDRPVNVVDLCCGMGDSTHALAWWLPSGSHIAAIELDVRFAAVASARTYRNHKGEIIPVTVHCASVLDGFRDPRGRPWADRAVDVVHAIGSIGCHFAPDQTAIVVRECERVLKSDGFALLDAGSAGTSPRDLTSLAKAVGLKEVGRCRSSLFDRYEQLVFRRASEI